MSATFAQSNLHSDVKVHLTEELETIPNSRLLLIKPRSPKTEGNVMLYIVRGREVDPF